MTEPARIPTSIDEIAEEWVDTVAELAPTVATYIGRFEHNGRFGDYSPEGSERYAEAARAALARLDRAIPVDAIDAVTKEDLARELRLDLELHAADAPLRDLNVIASPAQDIRSAFDLMPTDTVEDWSVVAQRLGGVPAA
ncbi:MAG: hypothetical protein K0R60_1864, partial [Microbacterium sp.]|nr:hypothetical protein [Microbacterium sp.]